MSFAAVVWGAPEWVVPAAILSACVLGLVIWSYARSASSVAVRLSAGLLKAVGILALAWCLVEPLFSGVRPRPGANLFVLLADNSQSLQVRDSGDTDSRGEKLKELLEEQASWQTRLSQDFDVRRYLFDTRLRPVTTFDDLAIDGNGSALTASLAAIAQRYQGRRSAGLLLFTDGNATDLLEDEVPWGELPPIYPVMLGTDGPAKDISVARVAASQTNFEAAPVSVLAQVECQGYAAAPIDVEILGESGEQLEKKTVFNSEDREPIAVRFQLRPEKRGISFYTVRAYAQGEREQFETAQAGTEATLINNSRLVMVDRAAGPYRVLYVTGRPNWEFKFIRRAIAEDNEVQLVGLVRIAKREPKFTFRGRVGERTNPLYRGFGNQGDEEAEQYDQPVILRLGTEDEDELRDGFPKAADELFRYHAIILDDVEAEYFSPDQMSLVQDFVSDRGGGLLMLGGQESFYKGEYRRTPIGELLPIYLDGDLDPTPEGSYRLTLTREGWVQPWVRLRTNEQDEKTRLDQMPKFKTLNQTRSIKPGATVLAHVESQSGARFPALVVQRFGLGRSAAFLVGDFWRWNLRRENWEKSDLEKSWRQMARWLVADVPQRVQVETQRKANQPGMPLEVAVTVRDELFKPLDNATVQIEVKTPEGKQLVLTAEPSETTAGKYLIDFVPRIPGAYRASVTVTAPDGSEVGRREAGWTSEPATDEFRSLVPNRSLLERIAEQTEGKIIAEDDLHDLVTNLPNRKNLEMEEWIYPLWHQWGVFLLAIGCLVTEWGLRRWRGLP